MKPFHEWQARTRLARDSTSALTTPVCQFGNEGAHSAHTGGGGCHLALVIRRIHCRYLTQQLDRLHDVS